MYVNIFIICLYLTYISLYNRLQKLKVTYNTKYIYTCTHTQIYPAFLQMQEGYEVAHSPYVSTALPEHLYPLGQQRADIPLKYHSK